VLVANHTSHPIKVFKWEKFRKFRTSLLSGNRLSIGAIIEWLYLHKEQCLVINLTLKYDI